MLCLCQISFYAAFVHFVHVLVYTVALHFNYLLFKFSLVRYTVCYHLLAVVPIFVLELFKPFWHIINVVQMKNLVNFVVQRFRPGR